jgi:hypothetical protein
MQCSKNGSLFDHLVGNGKQLRWHFQPKCLGGPEVDEQLEFRGLYDRQVGGLFPPENATCVKSRLSVMPNRLDP